MRLISQDGMIDVPYEQVAIELKESEVWCEYSATVQSYCTGKMVAKYTTEAKALKVMEMLRASYVNNECYKSLCSGIVIPLPNNSDDMKEKMVATRAFRETTIFQFPKDEEVEV